MQITRRQLKEFMIFMNYKIRQFVELIPIYTVKDLCGSPVLQIDPAKIIGVVETNRPDEVAGFSPVDEVTAKIGDNVAKFLAPQIAQGIIPREFFQYNQE
jgi:acyl-CoA hydrolase